MPEESSQGVPPIRTSATGRAIIYTVVTCTLSWSFLVAIKGGLQLPPWAFLFVMMWIPAVVSLAMRGAFREGCADAGLLAGRFRYWAWAYLCPLALATVAYATACALQQVHITPYLKQQSMYGPVPFRLTWWNADSAVAGLLFQRFFVTATLGVAIGFIYGLGEEIGWRGYLLPKLVRGGVKRPIFISGVIWGAWHIPFVLLFYEQHRYITSALYALGCVIFGVFMGWLRLASGSVFVAAMAHAAYNTFFQDLYDHSFAGPNKWFWAGDVGFWCSVAFGALAIWLYQSGRITASLQRAAVNSDGQPGRPEQLHKEMNP